MALNLNYFYGNEAEQYSFYRIPKILFTDPRYQSVSVEAKVLYGLLLDRMCLSARNNWFDPDGRVFIYFTLEEAAALLGFGKDKTVKLFKELDSGIGLIERKKQGQGRPTRIYVKNFLPSDPAPVSTPEKTDSVENNPAPAAEMRAPVASAEVCTSEKPQSRLLECRSLDFCKTAANKTDKNNTELSETDLSIHPACAKPQTSAPSPARKMDGIDVMDSYRELVKENIDYDILLLDNPYDEETIDGYVELIAEVCCSRRESLRINQEEIPTEIVKSRLLKLNSEHIRYVMDCMRKNTALIGNIRAYTLSALFNAPVTISPYYTALVGHDMAQGFGVS